MGDKGSSSFSTLMTTGSIVSFFIIVTPDTCWMHIAGALDRKLVTLFGSIDPIFRTGMYDSVDLVGGCPYDLQPCWYDICDTYDKFMPCMMNIELSEIIRVTMERLDE